MKVLYIVGGEGNRYGSEIIAIDLLSAGKKNGIDYIVVTANKGAVSDACSQLGIENYVIPFKFFVYKAMSNPFLNFVKKTIWKARAEFLTKNAVKILEKTVDMRSVDLIHTNLSRDLLGGVLAERNNIPHVWHIHELYKAHYQLSFLKKDQVGWMAKHANKFIAISKTVADEWIGSGLPKEKVKVVYNGIDVSKVIPKSSVEPGVDLKLVMVGHIVPAKGQELVIKSLLELPDELREHITIDCFGEGTKEYKEKLLQIALNGGIRLALRGYCSDIGIVLRDYDVGINCSRGEGFGLSTVEYMAAKLCPVVANTGANGELIEDGKNGFIFEYNDIDSLAKLISYLYSNREIMNAVACTARETAVSKYSLTEMEKSVSSILYEIANK